MQLERVLTPWRRRLTDLSLADGALLAVDYAGVHLVELASGVSSTLLAASACGRAGFEVTPTFATRDGARTVIGTSEVKERPAEAEHWLGSLTVLEGGAVRTLPLDGQVDTPIALSPDGSAAAFATYSYVNINGRDWSSGWLGSIGTEDHQRYDVVVDLALLKQTERRYVNDVSDETPAPRALRMGARVLRRVQDRFVDPWSQQAVLHVAKPQVLAVSGSRALLHEGPDLVAWDMVAAVELGRATGFDALFAPACAFIDETTCVAQRDKELVLLTIH